MEILFDEYIFNTGGSVDLTLFSDGDAEISVHEAQGERAAIYVKWDELKALVERAIAAEQK